MGWRSLHMLQVIFVGMLAQDPFAPSNPRDFQAVLNVAPQGGWTDVQLGSDFCFSICDAIIEQFDVLLGYVGHWLVL